MVFLLMAGVFWLLYTNRTRSRERATIPSNWSSVTGRITAAHVETSARTRVEDDEFYYPEVEFEYTIEGRVFTARQAAGRPFNLEFKAKQTLKQYPVGRQVEVYYSPEKPEDARIFFRKE
jgi:hypothetical protein